jgi:hypothetical protein
MGMTNDPLSNRRMPQIEGCVCRVGNPVTKTNTKTTGSAKPTVFTLSDQCSPLYIASSAANNVANANEVSLQTLSIERRDPRYACVDNSVVADILRHN